MNLKMKMKVLLNRPMILAFIILLILNLLSACGPLQKNQEQEGGITGTGLKIECNLELNKKRKECLDKGVNKILK